MKFKKLLSIFAALSITVSGITIPVGAADSDLSAPEDYLLNLTFDENGTGNGSYSATAGGMVTEHGSVAYADGKVGKALSITEKSADNYLSLADGILNGKTEATYSFYLKAESDSVPNWAFMTTPETSHTFEKEKYVGMLSTTSEYTVERYNNSGARISSVSSNGNYNAWKYVTVVVKNNATEVYINGILVASDDKTVDLSGVFTSDSMTWIGHANWGTGEGFKGMIDEFRIYGRALDEDEVISLADEEYDKEIANILKEYNRIDIKTNFYKDNNKVFQCAVDDVITVKTSVENLKPQQTDIEISLAGYDENNAKIDGTEAAETYTLNVKKKAEFEKSVTVENNVSYYKVTVTENKGTDAEKTYDAGRIAKSAVVFPDASPADTNDTTGGVHDPTIFKDPVSGRYYVYSTHDSVFESDDLINWEKHDYANTVTIPDSARAFRKTNFNVDDTETYWAPDIYYKEGDEYPYWFYLSVSGFGSAQSVICLVKAKSPGLWDGDTKDCGVVIASNSGYNFNCIDANIYTETDGKVYFFFGSFNRGIHMAELDADTGLVKGIDYTSDETLLSTSKSVAVRMYSTPKGVVGPEGAYVVYNEDTGYRYMFTSYGYLGTNYNIRAARTDKTFTEVMADTKSPHHYLRDHKDRKVGTTYTEQTDTSELWGYKVSGSFRLGDGIEYVGSGHNSVFKDYDGQWYLVQHCRKVEDGLAYLQVKKILWTKDGWPVISPMVYAGEKEQKIPAEMIYGTWDLSSVGHTILSDDVTDVSSSGAYKGTDLPVESSEIVLQPDGSIGDNLGTWEFDGNYTVTLTFERDGYAYNNQYFSAGDTMTLFVLTAYDKDAGESALVMTGTDQNCITQFAKKSSAAAEATAETVQLDVTPIVLEKSNGSNPMLGFDADGNILYAGDPAALVDGDTVYLYAGHDDSPGEYYRMPNWECYSSQDMVNWKYEGVIMKGTDISWRVDDTTCWASQVIKYNGTYYFYWCTTNKNDNKYHSIGVAVSDSPTGPFTPLDTPIVRGYADTPESTTGHADIDPTVWVETVDGEEHRYLAWGNTWFHVCELNEDMTTGKDITDDGVFDKNDIKIQEFKNLPAGLGFTEAPWIYRRTDENGNYTGKYYMFGAFGWREQMGYVTSDSMWGPWEWGGVLMPPTATSNTNHPAVIDFKGKTYFIYHNGSLPYGSGFHRVVCAEEFTFNEDGSIDPIQETSTGLTGTKSAIKQNGGYIYYENFINPSGDGNYPLTKNVYVGSGFAVSDDTQWEIVAGKADTKNENYVSIQAVNKPGLYLKAMSDSRVVLTQDSNKNDTATQRAMTFKTVKGLDGGENSVSFESVFKPGYFLSSEDGALVLASSATLDVAACSFEVDNALTEGIITPLLAEITNAWIKDGSSVRFHLNNAEMYESVCAYAAEYKDGKLLGAGVVNNIKVTSSTKPIVIPYERKEADSKIKIFVWKDMLPAAEAVEVTVAESPYTMPDGYTSYFAFDENMKDAKTTAEGVLADTNIDGSATATAAVYEDGYNGKAIAFSGSGSYGVNLGTVITNKKYTVAFRMKANAFTACTSAMFINSGTKSSQKWVSAPFGDLSGGATKIWSTAGSGYLDVSSTESLTAGEWHHIAISADGGTASIYVDGIKTGTGSVADVVSSSTNTYLGVNFWDTPFNGLIDDLYIYNGVTLDDESVTALYEATSK